MKIAAIGLMGFVLATAYLSPRAFAVEIPDPVRKSVDGELLPPPLPRAFNFKMGALRNVFDEVPEHVANGKCWSMQADADVVSRWKGLMSANQIDYEGFDWIAHDDYHATVVMFSLTDGRVSKIGLFMPDLTDESLTMFLRPIKEASSDTEMDAKVDNPTAAGKQSKHPATGKSFSVVIHGMKFYGTIAGSHTVSVHHEHHSIIGQPDSGGEPDTTYTQPSFVEFQASPISWWVYHQISDPKMRQAVFAHQLQMGMTQNEAIAAKMNHPVAATDASKTTLVWYEDTVKMTAMTAWNDSSDGSTMTEYVPTRKTVAKATFKDGRIVDFTDSEDNSIHVLQQ